MLWPYPRIILKYQRELRRRKLLRNNHVQIKQKGERGMILTVSLSQINVWLPEGVSKSLPLFLLLLTGSSAIHNPIVLVFSRFWGSQCTKQDFTSMIFLSLSTDMGTGMKPYENPRGVLSMVNKYLTYFTGSPILPTLNSRSQLVLVPVTETPAPDTFQSVWCDGSTSSYGRCLMPYHHFISLAMCKICSY